MSVPPTRKAVGPPNDDWFILAVVWLSRLQQGVAHPAPPYARNRKVVLGGRYEDAICESSLMVKAPAFGAG